MILYLRDWQKYPDAIVDYATTNASFVRMARLLHDMGVKNCLFLLALHNPDLQGVDPFDEENLTEEQKLAIAIEAKYNPWYVFRELIRIPPKAGNTPIPFRINRASLSLYWLFFNHITVFLIIFRQAGKAQPLDSKIRVPGGWMTMGAMSVGQDVIAPDGTITKVVGVYPQGVKPVYEFTFADGRTVKASDEHLWRVWDRCKGRNGEWRVLTTLEVIERQERVRSMKQRLGVQLVKPEDAVDKKFLIHPYALGALLGDGGFTHPTTVRLTNIDADVVEYVRECLPDGLTFGECINGQEWNIRRTDYLDRYKYRDLGDESKVGILPMLDSLGLKGKFSHEKFVPTEYLEGSHAQRLQLLQGLMDTDGTIGTRGSVTFDSSSKQLAEDVRYLVRSLGGLACIVERKTGYRKDGELIECRTSYRVLIRHFAPVELFYCARKRDRAQAVVRNAKFNSKLYIHDIKYIGEEECQCIEVAHQDHLYITDNFTVTHNTMSMSALVQGCLRFWMDNSICSQVTKDTKLKLETIDTIKEIGERFPSYLVDVNIKEDNPENKMGIYYAAKNNTFKSMVGRNDAKAANGVGRGSTSPFMWFDEPPFTPFIGITVPAAIGSMGTVVEEAAKNNQPYGVVFTTTPGKIDDRDGGFIYKQVQAAARWSESMFDSLDKDDLIDLIKKNSTGSGVAVNCTFTHNQLGYTDEWLNEKIAASMGTKEQADMDYRVIWSSGGASSPISVDQADAIRSSEMEPTFVERTRDNYFIRWYDNKINHDYEMQQGNYILGIDSSEAVGKDAIAMVITNVRDLSVVGVATVNDTNLTRYAYWLCDLLIQYPKITAIIERKSTGTGIMDQLLYLMQSKNMDPFKRIYNHLVDDQNTRKDDWREMTATPTARRDTYFYDKYRRDFGFVTDRKNRQLLYQEVLAEAVKRGARKVHDKTLAGEIRSLIVKKGRVDHPDGGHDDHVIAWLMCVWFLMISKHHSYYGIDRKLVFADITDDGTDLSEADKQRGMMVESLHEQLDSMFDQLRKTENPYALVQLEQGIRRLNTQLAQMGGNVNNIDGLIQEALAERQRRHLHRSQTRSPTHYGQSYGIGNHAGYY